VFQVCDASESLSSRGLSTAIAERKIGVAGMHPAALPDDELIRACEFRRQRRSGPGGQHRNKVETAVFIRHLPTGVEASATERRSQEQNRQQALFRLRIRLALEIRQLSDEPWSPSSTWQSRNVSGRLAINPQHEDFPTVLAEAMDVVHNEDYDVKKAAARLSSTSSQIVKLLHNQPEALRLVNEARKERAMRALQ